MQRILLFSLFGVLILAGISCNLLTAEEPELDYPTIYTSIEFSDLQQMNEEYQSANDNKICSTLNKYGFTGFSELFFEGGESPCAEREIVRVEMKDPDTLVSAAKRSILKNEEYTGVQDTSLLEVKESLPLYGCTICDGPNVNNVPIEWKITFKNQKIDTLELPDTEIVVFLDAEGVNRIWGNWYPDIVIPDFVNYGYMDVQEGMVGWEIDLRPYTGKPEIYTIEAGDLQQRPKKVLFPFENEDTNNIEIRYCWAVPVDFREEDFKGWWAYVDIEEGLLIQIKSR
ncbi:MAG: hypothetical protein CL666_13610 [Balneola sp.]|nr:hypothetical protein [Balneola sp.]